MQVTIYINLACTRWFTIKVRANVWKNHCFGGGLETIINLKFYL